MRQSSHARTDMRISTRVQQRSLVWIPGATHRSCVIEGGGMVRLEDARRIIAAAEKQAQKIGQPMNIAVADEGGNLVAHVRMDGAWLGSIDISINKAFTARAFDIQTKDLAGPSQPGGQFYGIHVSNHGRVMIF